jgi:hypothetical protein
MKLIFFILLLSLTATVAFAQYKENSVCMDLAKNTDPKKETVLVICNRGTGMSALPRTRLHLRVYADGTAEYEENDGNFKLAKRALKVGPETVARIVKFGAAKDFQDAAADYPRIRIWTDSGLETTILFRDKTPKAGAKKVMVHNYTATDLENDEYFPPSLVALMLLANEIRTGKVQAPKIIEYNQTNRTLEVGKTYRGKVNFGDAYGMRLTPFPKLPMHHSVMYSWPNVKDFPALDPDKDFGVRTIIFKVAHREVDNFRKNDWITTFTIEIVKVVE